MQTMKIIEKLRQFVHQELWRNDTLREGPLQAALIWTLRVIYLMVREMVGGQLNLRAMGLVYTTLLSLVPLLAVSFSVLKAFGVHNMVEPLLFNLVAPLGEMGTELVTRILGFVENMKVGVLGFAGLALLIYTVISLIQKVESTFNSIWRVKRARSFSRRFSDYLSVLLVGPVLVFSAIGITASILNNALVKKLVAIEPFGTLVLVLGKLMPFFFVIAAFTFIYMFVPNIRVKLRSALLGGTIAGIAWEATGMVFASFAAGSTRYAAIYSGFAILILFMIWLYLSWLILLVGAQVAYYHQHPEQLRRSTEEVRPSNRLKERLGLLLMYLITEDYYRNGKPWTLDALVQRVQLPADLLDQVLVLLEREGFLIETGDDPPAYYPARAPETVSLAELFAHLRTAEEGVHVAAGAATGEAAVDEVMSRLEQAMVTALAGNTLRDLVGRGEAGADETSAKP